MLIICVKVRIKEHGLCVNTTIYVIWNMLRVENRTAAQVPSCIMEHEPLATTYCVLELARTVLQLSRKCRVFMAIVRDD